jgi:hypothetical protein
MVFKNAGGERKKMGVRAAAGVMILALAAIGVRASGIDEGPGFDTTGVDRIDVRSGVLAVEVTRGDSAEAELSADTAAEFPWDEAPQGRLRQERDGSRLHVWVEGATWASAAEIGKILVRVPRGASVTVKTSSGSVTVEGLEGGACSVRTVSGPIRLSGDRCLLSADSVSGAIDIDSTGGGVEARTVSGRIEGRRLALSADSDFSSVSGSISVDLALDVESYGFDLRSVSGPITVGTLRTERGLRMGFGRPLVRGHTVSGALSFSGPLFR